MRTAAVAPSSCAACHKPFEAAGRSKVYKALCLSCGSERWGQIVHASVERRMARAIGLPCKSCGDVTLTAENQVKTYPGMCRSCYNVKHKSVAKASRSTRLKNALGKLCKQCSVKLTEQSYSVSQIGYCKTCAKSYGQTKRLERVAQVILSSETLSCKSCNTPLTSNNISKATPHICRSCRGEKAKIYAALRPDKHLNEPCASCEEILTPQTQSRTSPKLCLFCARVEVKTAFGYNIGKSCSKCSTVLTEANQSRGHVGKCKPCRNLELKCSSCGNKGGVYKGKLCSACAKK